MLQNLYFARFILTITAKDCLSLPPYKGATFRGGFGNTFKRIVCIGRNKDCETCLLKSRCLYVYIFETPPPADTSVMRKYRTAPHPFVIEPPMSPRITKNDESPLPVDQIWGERDRLALSEVEGVGMGLLSDEPIEDTKTVFEPGEKLSFGLLLIGKAMDSLPYFIYTFEELGNSGIGKGRGRYVLEDVSVTKDTGMNLPPAKDSENPLSVDQIWRERNRLALSEVEGVRVGLFQDETPESIYSATDKKLRGPIQPQRIPESNGWEGSLLTLSFLTPARIVYEERLTQKPEFHILIRNLLRRIAHLSYFHCGGDPSGFDFTGPIDRAMKITTEEETLRWYDWERYSARQDARMKLGGFVGDITFEGDLGEFLPYLRAGEIVHIGKGTSFGLGKYVIRQGARKSPPLQEEGQGGDGFYRG